MCGTIPNLKSSARANLRGARLRNWTLYGGAIVVFLALQAGLNAVQKGIDEIAQGLVAGLEAVLEMESPFGLEYREMVYRAVRYAPGGGFEKLLTEDEVIEIIQRARKKGHLGENQTGICPSEGRCRVETPHGASRRFL